MRDQRLGIGALHPIDGWLDNAARRLIEVAQRLVETHGKCFCPAVVRRNRFDKPAMTFASFGRLRRISAKAARERGAGQVIELTDPLETKPAQQDDKIARQLQAFNRQFGQCRPNLARRRDRHLATHAPITRQRKGTRTGVGNGNQRLKASAPKTRDTVARKDSFTAEQMRDASDIDP